MNSSEIALGPESPANRKLLEASGGPGRELSLRTEELGGSRRGNPAVTP
jgi:hypothetical protein